MNVKSTIKNFKHILVKNNLIYQIYSKNLLFGLFYILAGLELKKLSAKCKTVRDFVELALNYKYSIFKRFPIIYLKSLQKKTEIIKFCKFIIPLKPKIILEIGTHNGGTLFLLSRLSSLNALIISIDLPGGPYGVGYPSAAIPFFKSFSQGDQKIVLIRKNSHQKSTFLKIKKLIKKRRIDLLFIDGDHTYNGVQRDYEMYSPLVKKSGIIVFHDIVHVPPEIALNVNVHKFWTEIKKNFKYKEIVEDWNQGHYGIGILEKDKM